MLVECFHGMPLAALPSAPASKHLNCQSFAPHSDEICFGESTRRGEDAELLSSGKGDGEHASELCLSISSPPPPPRRLRCVTLVEDRSTSPERTPNLVEMGPHLVQTSPSSGRNGSTLFEPTQNLVGVCSTEVNAAQKLAELGPHQDDMLGCGRDHPRLCRKHRTHGLLGYTLGERLQHLRLWPPASARSCARARARKRL